MGTDLERAIYRRRIADSLVTAFSVGIGLAAVAGTVGIAQAVSTEPSHQTVSTSKQAAKEYLNTPTTGPTASKQFVYSSKSAVTKPSKSLTAPTVRPAPSKTTKHPKIPVRTTAPAPSKPTSTGGATTSGS